MSVGNYSAHSTIDRSTGEKNYTSPRKELRIYVWLTAAVTTGWARKSKLSVIGQ